MYYVPATDDSWKRPITYVPIYSSSTDRLSTDNFSSTKLNQDLIKVRKELAELREELKDLRLEKSSCRLCSSSSQFTRSRECDEDCSICYSRISSRAKEDNYSRTSSPVHFCSICNDYVIDRVSPPPSPRSYKKETQSKHHVGEDKLSEYLTRQIDLQSLRSRYIPEERPVWIPTAYKHDYPHRLWATRHAHFSEP